MKRNIMHIKIIGSGITGSAIRVSKINIKSVYDERKLLAMATICLRRTNSAFNETWNSCIRKYQNGY